MNERYDVVVVGGGAAGLNGALMLGRSRRTVLVIDAGRPRNAPAHGVHGLLGRDGIPPARLLELGRAEVRSYGGDVVSAEAVGAVRDGDDLVITTDDGRSVRGRRLLVTTGLVDELPEVAGLRERWGRDVVHCPYCHGWEVRDQAIGVLGTSSMSVHQALLFRQLSDDVTFFTHDSELPASARTELLARGIAVVDGTVTAVDIADDRLTAVRLAAGAVVPRQAVAVATRFVARIGFLAGLGLRAVEHPSGAGQHLPADPTGRTQVPGVWTAGNVSDPFAQVGAAAAAGAFAGAQLNADLVLEETRAALAAYPGEDPVPA